MISPFVDAEWLAQHRDEVAVADVRWYLDGRPGRDAYEAGHIPGAVFVDLDTVLAEPHTDDSHGRHPLPSPERFAGGLAELGIRDGDTVIAYDDAGGVIAARLVWLLRAIGHEAALLDGGIATWPAEKLQRAGAGSGPSGAGSGPSGAASERAGAASERAGAASGPVGAATTFTPVQWPPHLLATIDEVAATDEVLIDARDRQRFAGGPDPVDPRSGHIPGAHSVPTREHLDESGRIQDPGQLRRTFAQAGIEPGTPVISYCGSGVTACHNLLVLERAGLGPARLYPGSWSEWSRDPARPVATGDD